jgi:hypothetical protein
MYRGAGATFRGWRRILALFVAARPAATLATIALTLGTAAMLTLAAAGRLPGAFAILWLAGATASAATRKSSGNSPLTGAFFPLDVLFLATTLVAAAVDRARGRAAPWRGREVEIRR